jgi:hypothetical protein
MTGSGRRNAEGIRGPAYANRSRQSGHPTMTTVQFQGTPAPLTPVAVEFYVETPMARNGRPSVLKRERERRKAEKAERKRERRDQRKSGMMPLDGVPLAPEDGDSPEARGEIEAPDQQTSLPDSL